MPERMGGGEDFLKKKYDLHKAPEVEAAADRAEAQTGEKVPQDPASRIRNYLDRLERLILDPEKKQRRVKIGDDDRPRALSLLRKMILDKEVRSSAEKLAEGAAAIEERAARELGRGAVRYGEEQLEQRGQIAVKDLENSLDQWITYLSDPDEPYPAWFRYYAFRNVLDLSDYDKDKGEFLRRSEGTVRLFPDIDRGALGHVQDMIESSQDPQALERLRLAQLAADTAPDHLITKEKAQAFAKLSFARQYAEGIRQAGEITPEMRAETRGEWRTYPKGSDPTPLWASLQNKGAAWCTKGFGTASTQLEGGDFHVFYTLDSQGKPAIPRIAIRMEDDAIGEVRGVADSRQNLEGNMAGIAEAKLSQFPGAERYRKASADMKALTAIEKKMQGGQPLAKDDLILLYEFNGKIEGFGYGPDPRVKELRDKRNPKEDAPIVLDCAPERIAWSREQIAPETKAYIGPLFPGVFSLDNLEHLYARFPEGRIERRTIEIGGKTAQEYEAELQKEGARVNDYAKDILAKIEPSKEKLEANLVRLTVADLGFASGARYDKICERAKELGLELSPAEVGPALRLTLKDQPMNDWFRVAMEPLTGRNGDPDVFYLARV